MEENFSKTFFKHSCNDVSWGAAVSLLTISALHLVFIVVTNYLCCDLNSDLNVRHCSSWELLALFNSLKPSAVELIRISDLNVFLIPHATDFVIFLQYFISRKIFLPRTKNGRRVHLCVTTIGFPLISLSLHHVCSMFLISTFIFGLDIVPSPNNVLTHPT